MKKLFVVNPVAGRRKRPDLLIRRIRKICRARGEDFFIRIWREFGQIDAIIEEAKRDQYDIVVAVGGDGTVHAVGTRLIGTDIALGIVPAGSGNGYAGHLGFSRRYNEAIVQNLTSPTVMVDTGVFGGIPFLNVAGIGITGEIAGKFAHSKKRGLQSYVKLGSQTYFSYESFPCTLEVDGGREIYIENVFLLDIANGTQWGTGAKLSPKSLLTDGVLTAVYVEKQPLIKVPKMLQQLFRGRLTRNRNVHFVDGKRFVIRRSGNSPAHVDGDPASIDSTILCEVKPKSLLVVAPNGRAL